MNKVIMGLALGLSFVIPNGTCRAEAVVARFDSGEPVNELGREIEIWLMGDGSDQTQGARMTFVKDDALGNPEGSSLRLDYDVDSENPAYNGMRMGLEGLNAAGYTYLNFYLKGDAAKGFTKALKIELIGSTKRPSPQMIQGVTADWKKFSIPLSDFWAISDWSKLEKFVVVFADINNDPKEGAIFIDHVSFSKEGE